MAKINISGVVDETLIKRFAGVANGATKKNLAKELSGKSQPAAGLKESLRVGAQTLSGAVRNVNTLISFVNISQSTLAKLGEMTEKLIGMTEKATSGGIGQDARNDIDRQFKKISKEFVRAVKKAEFQDKNILSKDGLKELFTQIGLDPEKSESIAAIFAKFVYPDKEKNSYLASEYSKNKRPPYIPPDAYGRGSGGSGDQTTEGSGRFETARTIKSGTDAVYATARDLNNDGALDIISSDASGNFSVQRGSGDGVFGKAKTFSAQGAQINGSETTADFNHDGNVDLIAVLESQAKAGLFLGNGAGEFKAQQQIDLPAQSKMLRSAFLDADSAPDLVSLRSDGSTVDLLKGDNKGGFQAQGTVTLSALARSITVSDIDGDGNADLLALAVNGNVELRQGDGNGNFAASRSIAGMSGANALHTADFDGDGIQDIALQNNQTGEMRVSFGLGEGSFVDTVSVNAGQAISSAAIKDIDRDGSADLVMTHAKSGTVSVVLSNGDGTFKAGQRFYTGENPGTIIAEDFSTDAVADLLTVNNDGTLSFLRGIQDRGLIDSGNFANSVRNPAGDGNGTTLGDFNRDGNGDLATAGFYVRTLNGTGTGSFKAGAVFGSAINSYNQVASGDLDGDGKDDIVAADRYGNGVSVFIGNGNGNFKAGANYSAFSGSPNAGERVKVADLNGDRAADVIISDPTTGQIGVLKGNGDGTLGPMQSYALSSGGQVRDFNVADFNSDGITDIVATTNENKVEMLYGQADGSFAAGRVMQMGESLRNITSGDFNGDGKLDIAAADYRTNSVQVALGNGDGTFTAQNSFAAGVTPWGITSADINADGKLDLLTANFDNTAQVLLGNGAGGFERSSAISTGQANRRNNDIQVADANNDGISDVVVTNAGDGPSVALGEATIDPSVGGGRGSGGGMSKRFERLFDSERGIRSRADAYVMLNDLLSLKDQITKNVNALDEARDVVGQNLDLVRAAGFAFLNLSEQISGEEEAGKVAQKIRDLIRRNASQALAQAENLEPMIVAALTVDDSTVN